MVPPPLRVGGAPIAWQAEHDPTSAAHGRTRRPTTGATHHAHQQPRRDHRLPVGPVGLAGAPACASGVSDPYDCLDLTSRAELGRDRSAPSGLDRDDDGEACAITDCSSSGGDSPGDDSSGDGDASSSDDEDTAMPSRGPSTPDAAVPRATSRSLRSSGGLLAAAGAGGLVLLRRRVAA